MVHVQGVAHNGGNGQRVSQMMTPAIAALSLLMSIAFAFYTVSNPKSDVLQIKSEAREDLRRAEDRIEQEILRTRELYRLSLTKTEHEEFARRVDKALDLARDEISRIRGDQVTRSEHQQHWLDIAERFVAVRDQGIQARKETADALSEIRREIGGQYTIGDQIKNLQDQIKLMSGRLDSLKIMDHNGK